MDASRFDGLTRSLGNSSRRSALRSVVGGGAVAAAGLLAAAPASEAKKKKHKKHCPNCPDCPAPSPPAFCAGKNTCAQSSNSPCQASGTECVCWLRQDTATTFCGTNPTAFVGSCSGCSAGQVC